MVLLVVDTYMPFAPLDVLVPLHSTFRPLAITAGVLAMYGMVIVLVTSWLRKPIGTKVWRAIHLLAVPAFTLALAHGVFSGTDTERWWMWGMYAFTGLIVLFLVIVRGLSYGYRPPRPAPPERAKKTTPSNRPARTSGGSRRRLPRDADPAARGPGNASRTGRQSPTQGTGPITATVSSTSQTSRSSTPTTPSTLRILIPDRGHERAPLHLTGEGHDPFVHRDPERLGRQHQLLLHDPTHLVEDLLVVAQVLEEEVDPRDHAEDRPSGVHDRKPLDAPFVHEVRGLGGRRLGSDRHGRSGHQIAREQSLGLVALHLALVPLQEPRREDRRILMEEEVAFGHHAHDRAALPHHRNRAHAELAQHPHQLLEGGLRRCHHHRARHHVSHRACHDSHLLAEPLRPSSPR